MKSESFKERTFLAGCGIFLLSLIAIGGSLYFAHYKKEADRIAELPFTKVAGAGDGTYISLDGKNTNLSQYRNKPLIAVAWASWSPSSGDQLALLVRVADETHATVPILAINRKEPLETANAYLDGVGRHDRLIYILDTADHFFRTSEGFAMPELIVYDKEGAERVHTRGTFTEDELRGILERYGK